MKKILKLISGLLCVVLVGISVFSIDKVNNSSNIDTPTRNVELTSKQINSESCYKAFDSYEIEYVENKVEFNGYDSLMLSDLYELDLISEDNVDSIVTTKYNCVYDYENGVVSLSVYLVDGEETSIIDTIYGVILIDDEENFDVAFDCEGEVLLLSELEEAGTLYNCGFWSKLKKVWNTTAGKIGTIATVAACAVVGVVCAVIPGAQFGTALAIGTIVGVVGGATTAAVATYIKDGAVDWEAVFCYGLAGGVVGAGTTALTFKITCNFFPKKTMTSILKAADKNPTSSTTYIGKYYKGQTNSYDVVAKTNGGNYFNIENYDDLLKKYGQNAMEEVNKNFIVTKYNVGNEIISTTNPYMATNSFAKEIQWLKELGGTKWQQIGESLWKLIR